MVNKWLNLVTKVFAVFPLLVFFLNCQGSHNHFKAIKGKNVAVEFPSTTTTLTSIGNQVSDKLTCGIDFYAIPKATHILHGSGDGFQVRTGLNSALGGVGVFFELINSQRPNDPVDILEARSAAGAGWQFTAMAYEGDNSYLFNQSAGNSTGSQHGYEAYLTETLNSINSTHWTPVFSDTSNEKSTSPCSPENPPDVLDHGALDVSMIPKQGRHGKTIQLDHTYSLKSLYNQNWDLWFPVKALYFNRKVAKNSSLRVYTGSQSEGWWAGPIKPQLDTYRTQIVRDNSGRDRSTVRIDNKAHHLKWLEGDYALFVFNIHGLDIGIVAANIKANSLRLNTNEYCGKAVTAPFPDDCGSVDFIQTDDIFQNTIFRQGEMRSFRSRYYVGTIPQLAALGFAAAEALVSSDSDPAPALVRHDLGFAESNSQLAGWPASSIITRSSVYSSTMRASSNNVNGIYLSAWTSNNKKVSVKKIELHARYYQNFAHGFPARYKIYLTNASNSGWDLIGTYSVQPVRGVVSIDLPNSIATYGIKIVPEIYGLDGNGDYFFQMAGIELFGHK